MKANSRAGTNRQILDEASIWFVEFRVGDVDAGSRARFDDWLRASPEHIRAYMEIAKTYVELPSLGVGQKLDVDALIASARPDSNVVQLQEAVPVRARSPGRRPATNWAVAASLTVVLVSAIAAWWQQRSPTYVTETGENRSLTLADGSTVNLNARSEIRIRYSKSARTVELIAGQALFEVTKDPKRPFVVKSGPALVRVVGTQFDVNRAANRTTVTVLEGRVAVLTDAKTASSPMPAGSIGDSTGRSNPGVASPTYVSAGEQVTVTGAQVSKPQHGDVAAATAWTEHRLIFDGTRLADVVEQFNRYNTRRLVIEAPALEDIQVSGVYASTDPASLIRFLKEQPGIAVIESDQAVRITRP